MTETMKPSGKELIGDIPSSWNAKPLKYCVAINKDVLLESTKPDYTFRYIDIGSVNFSEGITGYEEVTFENAPSRARRIVHNGDTIVSTVRTYLKAISRIDDDKDVIASTGFAVLTPTHADSGFLEFFCKSEAFCDEIVKQSSGIAYPAVNASQVGRVYMPIPPLPEQQVIAAFLDDRCGQIDVIVADLERQVEILRQYKKALITETVTKGLDKTAPMKGSGIDWIGEMPRHWEMKRLKFLGSARNGLTYAPEDVVDEDKGTLVLRSSNIQNDRLTFDDNVYVNCRIPKEIVLQENDLLICSRNGSQALIGKCALIDEKTSGQTYGAFMCVYRSRYNKFIHYVFLSDIFSYYLGTFLTSTVNQLTNLNLYNIQIPIPMDLNEQQAIVEFLDHKCAETDDLIAEKQKAAETMRQYKKSLIYEYVTGKKRVAG